MIVIGHTVVQEGRISVRFGGTVMQIDTGMQPAYTPTGRASALEISHGVFTAIYEDRRDALAVGAKELAARPRGCVSAAECTAEPPAQTLSSR